jgi:L-amino acid N-acyltransferase YncA
MSFSRHWLGLLFGWGAQALTPLLFARKPILKQTNPLKIEQLDRFDERFDSFWGRIKDKYAIMTVRDQAFLTWRFAPVAGHTYHILAAMIGDELVGYTVLRITDEIRGIPSGLVMDLLLEPGERGESAGQLLLEEAWQYFRKEKVWLAGGLAFPHTAEYAALLKCGYRPLPPRWAPRPFRIAFNCFSEDLPETSQVKKNDLFFTIADYEAH